MLERFYATVLPSTGKYCLFLLGSKQHVWASSLDSLADHTEARRDQQGVYFGTAAFKEATSRTQANVLALRALRLDIDAGAKKFEKHPDGAYETQRDALAALVAFIKDSRLAPTYIISSGEGLHVYYALDEDLDPATWTVLARRLGQACADLGLKADNTVTADTARILRPVGTLHPNGSRVSIIKDTGKVYSVAEIEALLPWGEVEDEPAITTTRKYDTSINSDVAMPSTPKSIHKIILHCGAMAEVAASRGDVPEPFWRAAIGIAKFTVEGAEAAHSLSDGYDGYDEAETQAKFDNWNTGPSTCAEFSKHTKACATCPHRGKIKSPVVLGYMTQEQVAELPPEQQPPEPAPPAPTGDPWDGHLPAKFAVNKSPNGMLTLVHNTTVDTKNADGEDIKLPIQVPVTHDIFWLTHWIEHTSVDDPARALVQTWDPPSPANGRTTGTVVTEPMKQEAAASRADLLKFLASIGVHLTSHKKAGTSVEELMKAQLARIKLLSRRPKITERFGLRILPDGKLVCAHGKHVIFPDGTLMEGMLSQDLRDLQDDFAITSVPTSATGQWDASVWDDHIRPAAVRHVEFFRKFYTDPKLRKLQLAAMLGLASPFMAFVTGEYHNGVRLPANGLTVSLYSQRSGRGKTDLTKVVMMAFGPPSALVKPSGQAASTDVARINRLSWYGTMPISMDEMGDNKESSAATIISAVGNGAAKDRGRQHGRGNLTAPPWALINIMGANRSQRDMVNAAESATTAIQARMIEMNVDDIEYDKAAQELFRAEWGALPRVCSGALGAVLHYAACRLGAEKLNKLVMGCVNRAAQLLGAEQDARFQFRALGAMMAAHLLLEKEGLALFPLQDLVDEFKLAHDAGVTYAVENVLPTDGPSLMQIMLSDLLPHTLVTHTETNRGLEPNKTDLPLNSRVPDVVKARHIKALGITYVSAAAVRDWCMTKKVSDREMQIACRMAGVMVAPNRAKPTHYSASIDLYKGMKDSTNTRIACFKISTRRLEEVTGSDWDSGAAPTNVLPLAGKATAPADDSAQPQENQA